MTQTAAAAEATQAPAPEGMSVRAARRVALFLGAWVAVPWLLVSLFLAPVVPGGWWTLLALLVVALAPIGVLIRGFTGHGYPSAFTRVGVLRPFLYVFLFIPLVAVASLVGALVAWPFVGPLAGGRAAVEIAALILLAVAVTGYLGTKRLVVNRVVVEHARLPAAFDGVRVAQLSDLHVGPHTSRRFLARIAAEVERAQPDIIAHTGDQVDDYDQDVAHFVRAFGQLRAPLGVYAIAGNHDIYAGWEGVRDGLAASGVRVLVNESVAVTRGSGADSIRIAGTGDPAATRLVGASSSSASPAAATQWGQRDPTAPAPDLDKTMSEVAPDAFSLVLAHNPALWRGLASRGASVTLSGHTHHGQISIPFLKWCIASPFLEHSMGRYDEGASTLYINPGTNYWGLPLRIGAWPEVTIVTLRRPASPP